jgi:tRNA A37 threonylcarbamoyladenosine synthetase subunit TsaC/SUA5/YrdC
LPAKDRPSFNPLISHVASRDAAFRLGIETELADILARCFWPGPLTLVLNRQPDCPVALLTTAGLDKIAGARASQQTCAEIAANLRYANRRAKRKPIRPDQPKHSRSCACWTGWQNRSYS